MPVPNGFVNNSKSPSLAFEFLIRSFFLTSPVTTNPYFISESSTEWPPTIGIPALLAIEAPPFKISANISFDNSLVGNPTIFKAKSGFAPIAYMSESELAAAI